jgi:hypothetical protein
MSLPQVQYQLSGRPTLLAGSEWALLNGRTIVTACRPITLARFTNSADVLDPRVVGGNLVFPMSSGRDAFLGHCAVSQPPSVDDQSTTDGMSCGATSIPFRSNLRAE